MTGPVLTQLHVPARRLRLVLAALYLAAGCGQARGAETVQALRYGVTLYHFYQQDYFNALTELMAAQQLGELGVHADKAELLRGGMSLSYGMDRVAEQLFVDFLSGPAAVSQGDAGGLYQARPARQDFADLEPVPRNDVDLNQAWFYLAKLAWRRGEPQRAAAALARMAGDYQGPLAIEANYLRASIALREGDELRAAGYLEQLPERSPWRQYHYYNLGAARAAGGDWSGAVDWFRQANGSRLRTAESKSLRDKAYTASGFALLAAGQLEQAREDFTRVRLDSPLSDRALLGYGWSFSESGDYGAALAPWQALGERSLINPNVREALLAIPYAYEQLGRQGIALSGYQSAARMYARELAALEQAIDVFRHQDLRQLLELDGENPTQWLSAPALLPLGEHAPYLSHLITQHSFQQAMREFQDLHRLSAQLTGARQRLQVLTQVDTDQQSSWATVIEGERQAELQQRHDHLQQQVRRLRGELEDAITRDDPRMLADAAQLARWQRLERASAIADRLGSNAEQSRRLALYRGLLLWQDQENYPARVFQVKRQMRELEALAQQAGVALQQVDEAIAQHHASSFAPRIQALQQRVDAGQQQVQLALGSSGDRLRQVAIAELERQAQQLTLAMGQSRLAVARLYDLGSPEVPR